MDIPETKFAWNGDVSLAYQVLGDGPIDLLYYQGYASNVDLNWESPALSRFLRSLAARARLIITDRRGWGCSDRFSTYDIAPLETLTDDLATILDAAGSERAVIFATHECSITASLFAATSPERTRGLIVCDPFARYSGFVDEGPGEDERFEAEVRLIAEHWGRPFWVAHWNEPREREWFLRYSRSAIPPGGLAAEMRRFRFTDPRAVYPTIRVPTLVLATTGGDSINSPENGRYFADAIPGARFVQHDIVQLPWLHWYHRADPIVAEVDRFLADLRDEDLLLDRVLATVLFTDIVGSTERLAAVGDARWHGLVDRSRAVTRSMIARYGGREVDTAGDGFFITFDGPGRAIRAAQAIVTAVAGLGLEIRAGIHTGECEIIEGKPAGLTVHIGARLAAAAGSGEVLVSDTVTQLLGGSPVPFEDRGFQRLKGIAEAVRVHALAAAPVAPA